MFLLCALIRMMEHDMKKVAKEERDENVIFRLEEYLEKGVVK